MPDKDDGITLWKSQGEMLEAAVVMMAMESCIMPKSRRLRMGSVVIDVASLAGVVVSVLGLAGVVDMPRYAPLALAVASYAAARLALRLTRRRAELDECVRTMSIDPTPDSVDQFEMLLDEIVRARRARRNERSE